MGQAESNESAAVKRQAEGGLNPMYALLDLGGKFLFFRKNEIFFKSFHTYSFFLIVKMTTKSTVQFYTKIAFETNVLLMF